MTCSGTQAALIAGQEAPRCPSCDQFTCQCSRGYTMEKRRDGGCLYVNVRLLDEADKVRAIALASGLAVKVHSDSFGLTPARADKWAALYDGGWGWDARGFYFKPTGHRWALPEAIKIEEDLAS